jgi:hypothetical protein
LVIDKAMNLRDFIQETIQEEFLSAMWKRANQPITLSKFQEVSDQLHGLQQAADKANETHEQFQDRTSSNSKETSKRRFEAVKNLKMVFMATKQMVGKPLEVEGVEVKFTDVAVKANDGFVEVSFHYETPDGTHQGEFAVSADEGFEFLDAPPGVNEQGSL